MSTKGSVTTADYMPYDEYQRFVNHLMEDKLYWWAAYCRLSFCTALRFSDVRKVTWYDILDRRKLIITAQKTNKTHVIPLGMQASEKFEELYELMGKPDKSQPILVRPKSGGAVSIQYVNRELKKLVRKYNIQIDNVSTHTFRKTFGRYVYQKMDCSDQALVYLNRIFKHSSMDTTMIYIGIRDDEISDIYNSLKI